MMNRRWIAALAFGIALGNPGCESKEPGTTGQQAGSAGEASPSTQPSGMHPARPAPAPGRELTLDLGDNVTLKLVEIPAGKFLMGSPDNEEWPRDHEGPRREVTISRPFYMGVTPVTVNQFAAFVADSGYKTDAEKEGWSAGLDIYGKWSFIKRKDGVSWRKPSFDQNGDHPVVQVSWNDAMAFCDWLSTNSGKTVGLPTEAQWEYACRAGTTMAYPWSDDPDDRKGWANTADHPFSWDDGFVFTSPVGHFKANAFGLYDMIGNVLEWCQDWHGDYGRDSVTDPTGPDAGGLRVLRGGSWYSRPFRCRSAYRFGSYPINRIVFYGFRVAADGGMD